MISEEDILETAEMCKLKLTQYEIREFVDMFSSILQSAQKLNELNTDAMEVTTLMNPSNGPMREDIIGQSLNREEVLKNAPEQEYGYFKLLRAMD